jgi:hypothetical protein
MRLAIVVSSNYPDREALRDFVLALPAGTTVITTGTECRARLTVEQTARKRGLPIEIHTARVSEHGAGAGLTQMEAIARTAERVVVFWDGESFGAKHAFDTAERIGTPCELRALEPGPKRLIRAITFRHPWLWAVRHLGKRIENRTWRPPRWLIGCHLALHGGSSPSGKAVEEVDQDLRWILARHRAKAVEAGFPRPTVNDTILCGIQAVAPGIDGVTRGDAPSFARGQHGIVLGEPTWLPQPVPARGQQGLWELDSQTLEQVREAFKAARQPARPSEPDHAGTLFDPSLIPDERRKTRWTR